VKKKYRHLCKTICAEFLPRTMLGIKKFSNPSVRTIRSEFFIEQSITILINSSCNVRTYHLQQQNNMYTKDSDIWFEDGKSHHNINTITATSTAVYVKIIFYFFMISLIVMLNCFFNLSTKLSRDVNSFVPNI